MRNILIPMALSSMAVIMASCRTCDVSAPNREPEVTVGDAEAMLLPVEHQSQFVSVFQRYLDNGRGQESVNAVMRECVELTNQRNGKRLIDLLDAERLNIYAHPANSTSNCYELHEVMSALYALYSIGQKTMDEKTVVLLEYSRRQMEQEQMGTPEFHDHYWDVMNELYRLYGVLGDDVKRKNVRDRIVTVLGVEFICD